MFLAISSSQGNLGSKEEDRKNILFTPNGQYHSANQLFDDTLNSLHPMALVAQKEDNESYTFKQMLKQPDAAEFVKATMKETDDHESRGHWEVIPRTSNVLMVGCKPMV